jgi:squalene-hopene/tetraprenyl-beta-curcumene cyclase
MSPEQANTQFSATKYSAPRFGRLDADLADVESSIVRSREYLLSRQHTDGYWCGELEADSMLEADYIYLHTQLESGDPGRLKRAFTEMMRYQNEDGSWSLYPGGPGNISLSVKCYFSAKLMGASADDPRLVKCREWVLAHGGVVACNTFTKMYLCGLGQYDYDAVPAIPPEIVLFPNWFYFNIYESPPGRAPSSCPWLSSTPKNLTKKFPPSRESMSSSSVAAPTPSCACG